jgi:hypothetical protein
MGPGSRSLLDGATRRKALACPGRQLFLWPRKRASHRPVLQHLARHGDAELDLADRADDVALTDKVKSFNLNEASCEMTTHYLRACFRNQALRPVDVLVAVFKSHRTF